MFNAIGAHIYAGGFTLGVSRYFNVLAHFEHASYGSEAIRLNYPHLPVVAGGPAEWRKFVLPTGHDRVRFVYGNPPCALWASSSHGRHTTWDQDPRLQIHHDVFGLLADIGPDVFAIESVPPFFTKGRSHVDSLIDQAKQLGYSTTIVKHDAQHHDVAQARKRVFLVFHNVDIDWEIPEFNKVMTVRAAIKHLQKKRTKAYDTTMPPDLAHLASNAREGETLRAVFDRLYPNAPLNARGQVAGRPSFLDIRFPWDRPGPIVIGGKPIHPSEARYLAQEELAAICSFPPDYKWPVDTFGEISSLMSRGVMPKVGEWLAENVARAINDGKKLNRESSEILDITSSAWSYGELQPAAVAQVSRETSDTPETRENLARAPLARNARVLLTGSTPMQVGSDRTQLKIITAVVGWRNALTDMGYAVEHRPVTVGEDLSGYAHVIAILNQPNSLASSYVHGAVWCLHSRPDTIIALDDWQVKEIVSGAQTFARSQERMTRLHAAPAEYRDMLSAMYDAIGNKPWPWRVIAPILGAGDTSLLGVPRAEVIGIDPTAYVPRYPMPDKVIHREKRWVQATLLAKPLPPITWPLAEYGPQARAKGGGGGAGDKASPRLVESDLMRVYASSWGIISPAHPHAGSGWWRVRYLMAVDAGAILSGDIREARVLGNAYAEASDMRHVERMTPAQLAVLAIRQRACFEDITWSKDRVKTALKQVLKGEPPMVRRVMPSASTPTVLPTLLPPRTPGEGSGAYIRRLLMAGHNDSNAILAAVHAQFEGSKAAQSDINWNKGKLKKEGWIPGASPPRPTPPVVPTVVATPVATKPAPARTNGALRSDVARPDERLAKLANTLDPKVANALADIIEWMVARHV